MRLAKETHDSRMNEKNYVIDRVVRHFENCDNIRYVVRCLGYELTNDTVETAHYVPHISTKIIGDVLFARKCNMCTVLIKGALHYITRN